MKSKIIKYKVYSCRLCDSTRINILKNQRNGLGYGCLILTCKNCGWKWWTQPTEPLTKHKKSNGRKGLSMRPKIKRNRGSGKIVRNTEMYKKRYLRDILQENSVQQVLEDVRRRLNEAERTLENSESDSKNNV